MLNTDMHMHTCIYAKNCQHLNVNKCLAGLPTRTQRKCAENILACYAYKGSLKRQHFTVNVITEVIRKIEQMLIFCQ